MFELKPDLAYVQVLEGSVRHSVKHAHGSIQLGFATVKAILDVVILQERQD
jgi:hypothetical protein